LLSLDGKLIGTAKIQDNRKLWTPMYGKQTNVAD